MDSPLGIAMHRVLRLVVPILLAISVVAAIAACATNPATGKKDLVLMTEEQEIALGRETDPKIRKQYGAYDNAALQAYVQRVGEQVAANSDRRNLVYRFTVLDSSEVNAFALPGGYIYITRGILAYLNSEAELAAVLGHEAGHVNARHAVKQYTRATATGLAISIIGGGQAGQQLLGVLGNAILSGYGRDDELQADHLGATYIGRTGYDPQAMLGVMTVLKNQEEGEKKRAAAEGREPHIYHGVFASHPSADKRLQEVIAEAGNARTGANARVGHEEYLKQIDGMVFGDGGHDGVRRGSAFYHRDLNIGVNFPNGWRLENTPGAVNAYAPGKEALIQMVVDDLNKHVTPQEYLHTHIKANGFADERPVDGSALASTAATARLNTPFGARNTRVMVLIQHNRAFMLFGTAKDDDTFRRLDPAFLATARSVHALADNERKIAGGLHLRLIKAQPGDTFAVLAKRSPVSDYAELALRLINDKLNGEPTPGETIKMVE